MNERKRLTEKKWYDDYNFKYETYPEDIYKVEDKLGQLEDLEEKLGIDLITLFKALENEICVKEYNAITFKDGIMHLNVDEKQIEVWYPQYTGGYEIIYYEGLEYYGKTWALTKEELISERKEENGN